MEIIKSKSLFWDTEEIDLEENADFIIERVLNFGEEKDLFWILDVYGEKKIKNIVLTSRNIDRKFSGIQYNRLHMLKSLIYFETAEKEPMPKMLKKTDRKEVKLRITESVNDILHNSQ